MTRRLAMLSVLPALLLLALPAAAADQKAQRIAPADLRKEMRRLWEDHVTYTAFFYQAAIRGDPGASAILDRLLRNQDDIGNAVKPYYGDQAGHKLASLLRDHITIAGDVVKAAKANDSAALEEANDRWYKNADDLAALLSSANPSWPRSTLQDALHEHLKMVTDQVVATLHQDTAAWIKAYDEGAKHMLDVADILASGIVKQFPKKFSGTHVASR